MNFSTKQQGHLIMFVAISVFALNIPVSKYLFSQGYITPIGITITRIGFGTLAFWLASLFVPYQQVAKKDLLIILAGGFFGLVLNQGLFAHGLGLTSPVDASIISTSSPMFALVIAAIILREPITPQKVGGVLLGAAGAIFLVYTSHRNEIGQNTDLWGNISIVGAAFSYAFYLVITRPLSAKYSSVTIMKWMFLFALLIFAPFSYRESTEAPIFHQTNLLPLFLISFTLLGATFFTYLLIPMAQRRIRATTISMYNNLQPLIASFVAIAMGMDRFNIEKVMAALLIFSGVYLVTQSKSRAELDAEAKAKTPI